MKSNTIKFMQKSFVASLALSFILAFSVVAYLASPVAIRIQTNQVQAEEVEEETSAPADVSFSNLNLISLIEITDTATTTPIKAVATVQESQKTAPPPAPAAVKTTPKKVATQKSRPVRLIIPSIGLNTEVDPVGLNGKGEMAVPDGTSDNVGWYKNGTIPGNVGSAVIDAHVFAAFEELRYLKVGSNVIVQNANGEKLTFVVNDSRVYKLGELTSGMLFGKRDARRLNLITCAGTPTADGSTYTHRLVVYTTLVA